ncbi:hypothetical protein ACWD25_43705, partial [Streptomyces sp. NPDC002920]
AALCELPGGQPEFVAMAVGGDTVLGVTAGVGEVNAFGDLLPRLTGLPGSGAEGMDTYAAQVAAVLHDRHRTGTPHA